MVGPLAHQTRQNRYKQKNRYRHSQGFSKDLNLDQPVTNMTFQNQNRAVSIQRLREVKLDMEFANKTVSPVDMRNFGRDSKSPHNKSFHNERVAAVNMNATTLADRLTGNISTNETFSVTDDRTVKASEERNNFSVYADNNRLPHKNTILRPKKATAVMMKKNNKTQLSSQDTKALHSVL